ncbi:MAG: U32 family peptidase [bacterium]
MNYTGPCRPAFSGGGRPAAKLPRVFPAQVKEHIELVHSCGFSFNYLLNAPCHGGREFEAGFRREMFEYLDWIGGLDVDMITVSNPYLIELIRKEYPSLKIKAGSFAEINSVNTAMHFDELGVERITLAWNVNRKFDELEKIRKNVKCDLEVIVNLGCIYDCPLRYYHSRLTGHATQKREDGQPPVFVNYPPLRCAEKRINSPVELIKSFWIRPEDISVYEDIGITHFKIAGRTFPTGEILHRTQAYSRGKYDGNLLELLETASIPALAAFTGDRTRLSSILHVDNRMLDGFIDFFKEHECGGECMDCNYCSDIAKKAVKVTGDIRAFKAGLEDVLSDMVSESFTETDVYSRLCASRDL